MGQVSCKKCSTGTYVSEERHPGKTPTDCHACPYGKSEVPLKESFLALRVAGFVQSLEFLKKSLEICPAIFQTCKKVWKMERKSGKMVKSVEFFFFFFFKASNKFLISEFFFISVNLIQSRPYVCSASWKNLCFLSFLMSPLITYLIINLILIMIIYVDHFGKKSGRSLEFWIQKYVRTLGVELSLNEAIPPNNRNGTEQYPHQNTIPNQQNIHCYVILPHISYCDYLTYSITV